MIRRLVEGLSQIGVETHIATTNDNGLGTLSVPCGRPIRQAGVTLWYFERQSRFYTMSWPLSSWLSRHVGEYDIVHIHGLFSFASIPAAFWAGRQRVPYVVRPLGVLNRWGMEHRRPRLKHWSYRLIERPILAAAALVHYTSEQERHEAASLGLPDVPSVVIPNPVNTTPNQADCGAFRSRYPQTADRPIVLFLSRLDEKKGIDILLRAFRRVREDRPDALLVVAGNGGDEFVSRLKADAARIGISEYVIWPGFVEGPEKDALLADADVFVLPSYSENFGIAVAEAMAAGLPVIVSDQVAIHSDVAAAEAGLVVSCDPDSVADAMLWLLSDRQMCDAMGRAGVALCARQYSSVAVAQQVLASYQHILQTRTVGARVGRATVAHQPDRASV